MCTAGSLGKPYIVSFSAGSILRVIRSTLHWNRTVNKLYSIPDRAEQSIVTSQCCTRQIAAADTFSTRKSGATYKLAERPIGCCWLAAAFASSERLPHCGQQSLRWYYSSDTRNSWLTQVAAGWDYCCACWDVLAVWITCAIKSIGRTLIIRPNQWA